jgi:hypothetical protein
VMVGVGDTVNETHYSHPFAVSTLPVVTRRYRGYDQSLQLPMVVTAVPG